MSKTLFRAYSQKSDSIELETRYYYPAPIPTCQNGGEYSAGISSCSGSSSNSCMFGGMEESEVVDELHQILVDCLKTADITRQEILLRKFFFEIEKEIPLQSFLAERVRQSKISSLIDNMNILPHPSELETEINTRDINATSSQEKRLEKFKVRTVQVGVVVKEEERPDQDSLHNNINSLT